MDFPYPPSPEYRVACGGDEWRGRPREARRAKWGMLRRDEALWRKDTPPEARHRAGRLHFFAKECSRQSVPKLKDFL